MASSSVLLMPVITTGTNVNISSICRFSPPASGSALAPLRLAFVCKELFGKRLSNQVASAGVKKSEQWNSTVRVQAATSQSSKELERYSAKSDLLLSIKDAGGLKGLADRKADSSARIDVNEKLLILERMNPTPRPTTSPNLEGLWEFQFAGARSPGLNAAKFLLKRFPSAVASLTSLNLLIIDGESAKATGTFKVFNTVEGSLTLTSKLAVEGPVRLKEEYVEGFLAAPTVPEGNIPSQLKGIIEQFATTVERLPNAVQDVVTGGVKFPLSNTFSRELLISYLDEEVMVVRDKSGIPDVLVRIEAPATDISATVVPEYVS